MPFSANTLSFVAAIVLSFVASAVIPTPTSALGTGDALLRSLSQLEVYPTAALTVALGANVCVDLVAPAASVLGDAITALDVPAADAELVESEQAAARALAFHLGAAAERVATPGVLAPLVERATSAPSARHTLGANAALMARTLAARGARVILGGPVGPVAASELPGVTFALPLAANDEVHLILEYGAGESVGGRTSPRANRFILTADVANSAGLAEGVAATVAAAREHKADLLVVSGLHMLEPLPAAARAIAVAAVARSLRELADDSTGTPRVHVELASVASISFLTEVARAVLPHADSVGFNEQELAALFEALGGRFGADGGPSAPPDREAITGLVPTAVSVATALRHVYREFPRLSRAHFHALAYHVIAHRVTPATVTSGSITAGGWGDANVAVATGAVAGAEKACALRAKDAKSDEFRVVSPSRVRVSDPEVNGNTEVRRLSLAAPTVNWTWALGGDSAEELVFALAPVPVCKAPRSTVGLGDTISASALGADVPKIAEK